MSRLLIGFLLVAVLGLGALVVVKMTRPPEALIGTKQPIQGQQHIQQGEEHESYNSQPASSGPHYADSTAPVEWGIYTEEIQPEVYVHNLEHGGIVIAYDPSELSEEDLQKLKALLIPSNAEADFKPSRFILTPSTKISKAIGLSAWGYTLDLDQYDAASIEKFYNQHANNAPESGAAPTNPPIDQSAIGS